jgi:hypothetical protein
MASEMTRTAGRLDENQESSSLVKALPLRRCHIHPGWKPSNGLEPLTPSLPWASSETTARSWHDKAAISTHSDSSTPWEQDHFQSACPHGASTTSRASERGGSSRT